MYYFLDLNDVRVRPLTALIMMKEKDSSFGLKLYIYMLWFNFVLGLNFISFVSIIHYHTPNPRKIKFKARIKLNHNIYREFVSRKMCEKPKNGAKHA